VKGALYASDSDCKGVQVGLREAPLRALGLKRVYNHVESLVSILVQLSINWLTGAQYTLSRKPTVDYT
jgi:hypothetical protein